ncbi:MAG TPA: carboxypeptidase-like regulatory domain-containing protein [Planctomycetaceae bacterium]|jgi:hypothetical protein|nr:carboxypeptidase-like regulatory domain-containing protein [Planctomycetaceae bacterium]
MPYKVLVPFLLTTALAGCGDSAPKVKHPDRTKVSGTVTLKGTPVEGATVTLHPVQKGNGAFGITDASGKFTVGTFEKTDGAVPGDYKISVRKLEAATGGAQPAPGDPGYDPAAKPTEPKHLLPAKYLDFNKSGLDVKVGTEPITNLELKLE